MTLLVGGIPTLKNMKVSWDDKSNIWEKKVKNDPNQQPDIVKWKSYCE
jgi:hypothetical protein